MTTINLKEAKAGFSSVVDAAIACEFVTIMRHGKPVAVPQNPTVNSYPLDTDAISMSAPSARTFSVPFVRRRYGTPL